MNAAHHDDVLDPRFAGVLTIEFERKKSRVTEHL